MSPLLPGRATPAGTRRLVARSGVRHRSWRGLALAAVGLGTSLPGDDASGRRYYAPALRAFARGINVVDTAINYGAQSCERALGRALRRALADGGVGRDELFIVGKGGYAAAASPGAGALHPRDLGIPDDAHRGGHCLAPAWLDALLERSRHNLGLATLDLYLLHNPELHRPGLSAQKFADRMRTAFAALERACADGRIGAYGVATWSAFRVPPAHPEHLDLAQLLGWARDVGGAGHHFAAVEAPFNLAWTELATLAQQRIGRRRGSLFACARAAALLTLTSATLLHGALGRRGVVGGGRPELRSGAQRAIDAILDRDGLGVALVGMRSLRHVEEAASVLALPDGRARNRPRRA